MAVTYSPEVAAKICEQLALGRSLRSVCTDDGMPDESSVREWARTNLNEFGPQYAHARHLGYLAMADDLEFIADDGTNDYVERETQRGNVMVVPDQEHIQRSRLRVDTRKWLLSKMLPKIYGDKLAVEHSGAVSIEDRLRAGRARAGGGE